jgi:hypothetical protein
MLKVTAVVRQVKTELSEAASVRYKIMCITERLLNEPNQLLLKNAVSWDVTP